MCWSYSRASLYTCISGEQQGQWDHHGKRSFEQFAGKGSGGGRSSWWRGQDLSRHTTQNKGGRNGDRGLAGVAVHLVQWQASGVWTREVRPRRGIVKVKLRESGLTSNVLSMRAAYEEKAISGVRLGDRGGFFVFTRFSCWRPPRVKLPQPATRCPSGNLIRAAAA